MKEILFTVTHRNLQMPKICKSKVFKDNRGCLVPIEFSLLPFVPQRLFYVKDVPTGELRGNHAHHKTAQLLMCLDGLVEVILHDGTKESGYTLQPEQTLLIEPCIWDSQKFLMKNTVLLVLCNTPFDTKDYITNFEEFKKLKS